jgi:hypothetical protein
MFLDYTQLDTHTHTHTHKHSRIPLKDVKLFSFSVRRCGPTQTMASFLRFLRHNQRCTTLWRIPLDEWSAGRRDLYLKKKRNIHNRQTSMPPGEIWTHSFSRRAAADLRLRPRGHCDRRSYHIAKLNLEPEQGRWRKFHKLRRQKGNGRRSIAESPNIPLYIQ